MKQVAITWERILAISIKMAGVFDLNAPKWKDYEIEEPIM